MTGFQAKFLAGLIIGISLILAVSSVWNDSVIVDEVPHIGSGYSYLTQGDYRLNPEHPPLAKDLAAIPLLFQKIDKVSLFSQKFWTTDVNGQWNFGRFLLFRASPDPILSTRSAKLPVLIFFVLSACLIFHWCRKKYGDGPAFLSLILFLFSPTVIAHARFVTTDIAALFGVLFASYFFLNYLERPSKKRFWLASVFFGIALLTKFSTILLAPFFVLLAIFWGLVSETAELKSKIIHIFRRTSKTVLVMLAGFIIVVWPVYALHTVNYPSERQHDDTQFLLTSFTNRTFADPVVWASDKPLIRPAAQYALGLLMVAQRSEGGNQIYFRGNVVNQGGPLYFPIVYFIKEPLAWWGLVVMAIIGLLPGILNLKFPFFKRYWLEKHFVEIAMLLWLAIYWTTSIRSTLNIGVRHLLPTFPFAIMLVAGQIKNIYQRLGIKNQKVFVLAATLLTAWFVQQNLSVYPFYLTYFNESVGGPTKGYKIVADSNLDWGQDIKRLADFVFKNNIRKIDLDYFGWADQDWYLKNKLTWVSSRTYQGLEDFKLRNTSDGWIAVSATFLMNSQGGGNGDYNWLREGTPTAVIGNSIFVYHLR